MKVKIKKQVTYKFTPTELQVISEALDYKFKASITVNDKKLVTLTKLNKEINDLINSL